MESHRLFALMSSIASYIAWFAVLPWTVWYCWRFHVQPRLRPKDPKLLPYLIPWLGSAIGFFKNSHAIINSGLNKNRDPIAVTIAGQTFYMVVHPNHVIEVYKNTKTLSFAVFIQDLMLSCGAARYIVDCMSESPPRYVTGVQETALNPQKKALIMLAVDFHHTQLLPGPKSQAEPLREAFLQYINRFLDWDSLYADPRIKGTRSDYTIETSLLRFCGRVLIDAGTRVYWGKRLWELAPDMLDTFYDLDKSMWKLLFRYPPAFSKDAIEPRDKIIETLTQYYKLPLDSRRDAAWFTQSLESESRDCGLDEAEMAAAIMIIYFVVNGNTYKFCFWALCHILSDPTLHATIKREVDGNDPTREPTLEHLSRNCPMLDSVLAEVLRVYTSSASMRFIDEDTQIGDFILRAGSRIMLPYRQMHENADVFGSDCLEFKPDRFLKTKGLKRSPSYHPFGGGATLCAGRFVAQQEVLMFIGMVLHRFDVKVQGQRGETVIPRMDGMKPTFGMMAPLEGEDMQVRIKRRGDVVCF